jgi:hypothetical protein
MVEVKMHFLVAGESVGKFDRLELETGMPIRHFSQIFQKKGKCRSLKDKKKV